MLRDHIPSELGIANLAPHVERVDGGTTRPDTDEQATRTLVPAALTLHADVRLTTHLARLVRWQACSARPLDTTRRARLFRRTPTRQRDLGKRGTDRIDNRTRTRLELFTRLLRELRRDALQDLHHFA